MEVLKLTATTDASGYLNISFPTQLTAAEIDVVIVLNPIPSNQKQPPEYDFSDLVGRLTWQGNAVAALKVFKR